MRASIIALFAAAGSAAAKTCSYAGVNIAGLDFGTDTSGSCTLTNAVDPGDAGISQMKHFVQDDGLNAFRLPVSWYLTPTPECQEPN
jgi:endoglucanase